MGADILSAAELPGITLAGFDRLTFFAGAFLLFPLGASAGSGGSPFTCFLFFRPDFPRPVSNESAPVIMAKASDGGGPEGVWAETPPVRYPPTS